MIATTMTTITKIKIKAATTTIKYQTIINHMMILISMMVIWRITNIIIMPPQETGIMIPKMRDLNMIILIDLKMMIIMIQMASIKLKKILV